MDPLEKRLNELYRQKKREDEKSIPGFDAFRDIPQQGKNKRHSYFFLKMAASVVLVVATGSYYFHFYRSRSGKETPKIYPVNINQSLPTRSLLDVNATGYIWNWKAPTDKLLNDANKSLKTPIKI
jgi:heme/copper-type cytochrome/quinol oxidase subunit 2